MKNDPATCFAGMASAAPTLFRTETLAPGQQPQFALTASAPQRQLFERIIERTTVLSDGIWFGTPQNLAKEWTSKALAAQMPAMTHEHLVLCGKLDYWVPREHFDEMARRLPKCSARGVPLHRPLDEPGGPRAVCADLHRLLQDRSDRASRS